jgi:hypothetical protein
MPGHDWLNLSLAIFNQFPSLWRLAIYVEPPAVLTKNMLSLISEFFVVAWQSVC